MATFTAVLGGVLSCRFFVLVTIISQGYFQKISIMLPNLKKLQYLKIHYMETLVRELSTLATSQSLISLFNQLTGVLPLHLGKLSKLKIITLDFNDLQGPLPQSLMNCTSLVELRLALNNHLEGDITKLNFSKLVQLTKVDLSINNFTGKLPTSLYSCRSLKAIRLA